MTKNRPVVCCCSTTACTSCTSCCHQAGSQIQSGASARNGASAGACKWPRPSESRGRRRPLGGIPLELGVEDAREMLCVAVRRRKRLDPLSCEICHRGGSQIRVSARHYAVEVAEIGREVEREAVTNYRAVQLDADRCDLLAPGPDSCEARLARLRIYAELAQVIDQRLLEPFQVLRNRQAEFSQVEDRIAGQLPRTVIGRLAAAVRPDHVNLSAGLLGAVPKPGFGFCRLAHREDVRVFEEAQR